MSHKRIAKNIRTKHEMTIYEKNMIYYANLEAIRKAQKGIELHEMQKQQVRQVFSLTNLYNQKFRKFSNEADPVQNKFFSKNGNFQKYIS